MVQRIIKYRAKCDTCGITVEYEAIDEEDERMPLPVGWEDCAEIFCADCFEKEVRRQRVTADSGGRDEGYRQGQIDAAAGKMKYELVEQEDHERRWVFAPRISTSQPTQGTP